MAPVDELSDSPVGSEPEESAKVFPPEPPDEEIDREKAELYVPLSPDDGVVIEMAAEIVKERLT